MRHVLLDTACLPRTCPRVQPEFLLASDNCQWRSQEVIAPDRFRLSPTKLTIPSTIQQSTEESDEEVREMKKSAPSNQTLLISTCACLIAYGSILYRRSELRRRADSLAGAASETNKLDIAIGEIREALMGLITAIEVNDEGKAIRELKACICSLKVFQFQIRSHLLH